MAKYLLEANKTWETIIPASEIQFQTMAGAAHGEPVKLPERRFTTIQGTRVIARNKKDRDSMLESGNWRLI